LLVEIRQSPRGFTLVELSIVLVIMGMIGTLLYGTIIRWVGKEREDQAERLIEAAGERLEGSYLADGDLPAPDGGGGLPAVFPDREDPWGQDIRYWRATDLAGGSTDLELVLYADTGSGGPFPAGDATIKKRYVNAAYILVSNGTNQRMEATLAPNGTTLNVLGPGLAVNDGSNERFDDLWRVVSLNTLKGLKARQ